MTGAWDRPLARATRLLAGLVLFGLAMAALVQAGLGLDPWNVFHQGVARRTGLTIGQVTVISSLLVLAVWVPLGQRPGVGTIANAFDRRPGARPRYQVGSRPRSGRSTGAALVAAAIVATAIATGLYVGAGWGRARATG